MTPSSSPNPKIHGFPPVSPARNLHKPEQPLSPYLTIIRKYSHRHRNLITFLRIYALVSKGFEQPISKWILPHKRLNNDIRHKYLPYNEFLSRFLKIHSRRIIIVDIISGNHYPSTPHTEPQSTHQRHHCLAFRNRPAVQNMPGASPPIGNQ